MAASGGRGVLPADVPSGGHRRSVLRWHPHPPGEEHSETPPEAAMLPPLWSHANRENNTLSTFTHCPG